MKDHQICELTQLSISEAIDNNESLNSADVKHIQNCSECAQFYQLWSRESSLSAIASGSLAEQQNLATPIISQLEQNSKITPLKESNLISWKFLKLASIAATIAISSIFTLYNTDKDKPNDIATTTTQNTLNLKIPKLELNLTEVEIEKSLEKKYQYLSESATKKWRAATTGITRAKKYITNRTHYISTKYLYPENNNSNGPQSQLAPQQAELDPLQYG